MNTMNAIDPIQAVIIGLLALLILLVLVLIVVFASALKSQRWHTDQSVRVLSNLGSQVTGGMQSVARQLEVFGQIRGQLGELVTVGEQVNELSNVLKVTQKRGVWGEQMLGTLLDSLIPTYHGPFVFRDGTRVEQAIHLPDGKIVPIDSKFTLDAYRRLQNAGDGANLRRAQRDLARALRERIDETAQYIRPAEGTLDFALMFLPAEAVYYELVCTDNLCTLDRASKDTRTVWDYGLQKHVIPVSPSTMYAYLSVIVYGLRGLEIEKKAGQVLDYLLQLQIEFERLAETAQTLETHLHNAHRKSRELNRGMGRFGERLTVDALLATESGTGTTHGGLLPESEADPDEPNWHEINPADFADEAAP